ncbi:hypothetical protein ACWGB8_37765 [Kitasatospora sp. NPDC054939]
MTASGKNRDLATIADIVEPDGQGIDAWTAERVREVVAGHARDRDDRRLLLEALGLGEASG